ncbi:MAG: Uncharacterised protein [Marine Group II euryarchaeote MED-G33]|nr:MAG: Uncharacterised protein [Marine Group II euryarchaeote MED-G33]
MNHPVVIWGPITRFVAHPLAPTFHSPRGPAGLRWGGLGPALVPKITAQPGDGRAHIGVAAGQTSRNGLVY